MLQGRSKDRSRKVTPPGPVYMSNDQFAQYLSDLRNNRVSRPNGARPPPPSGRRDAERGTTTTPKPIEELEILSPSSAGPVQRSTSALSQRRTHSSLSTYSSVTSRTDRQLAQAPRQSGDEERILKPSEIVPSATYIERGQRWMEKEDVVSLRDAMQDMDLKKQEDEEARIHAAAQDEASELVYQHQNPDEAGKPDAPYRYTEHLRKNSYQHARTQSVGRSSGAGIADALSRRSISASSSNSAGMHSQQSRVSSGSSENSQGARTVSSDHPGRASLDSAGGSTNPRPRKPYGDISGSRPRGASVRKSSAKRNISGESAGIFNGNQIWEEPETEDEKRGRSAEAEDIPAPLRIKPRNPLNRVQFATDMPLRANTTPPELTKPLSRFEIHRNPPSQSRNPNYTANPLPAPKLVEPKVKESESAPVPMKEGLEIRSDEIRQATSMRLKDRSPKLPTPTVVSDKLGRPIVSFDADWKPKEADVKPEVRRRSPFDRVSTRSQRHSLPARQDPYNISTAAPTSHCHDAPSIQINHAAATNVPIINLPDSSPSIPTINIPNSTPVIPIINFPDAPSISISAPEVSTPDVAKDSRRPLPDPKEVGGRPKVHAVAINKGHWSPAAGKRATLLCNQCQLPIEGRSLFVTGQPERFHPACFICFTCGTSLEAMDIHTEPEVSRKERLDRIKRRARGEDIPENEGQTMAEDGDERLRVFCDLDWHENFAPRCKHCTTPIHGEHLIALGSHWHYGHFFCAECGDPFQKGVSHIEKDGYAWCLSCQTKRTERRAPKCKLCKQPVIGEYVQALGGEWHDKCFRCATCKGGFGDGQFYPKEVGKETVVLCIKCIERELKA